MAQNNIVKKEKIVWKVENLEFFYSDGTYALKKINLEIEKGKKIAIVGANGAGKSTLFLCSLGILEGWKGNIFFHDIAVVKKNYSTIRQKVGLVFQEPDDMLFMPTLRDDVAFAPLNAGLTEEQAEKKVVYALKKVGLFDKMNKPAHHLSVGEKRRAALACVISSGADILLFDEPTSGLDPKSRRSFISLVKELKETVIIATHDLAMAAQTTEQTIILFNGELKAHAPTEKLLFDQNIMEQFELEVPCIPNRDNLFSN